MIVHCPGNILTETGYLLITELTQLTDLPLNDLIVVMAAVSIAGIVRGFAGFGLSAIVMASVAFLIPPVELIPICFVLEGTASLAMFRGGMRNADMKMVWVLVITSAIGLPLGLLATTSISTDHSKLVALCLILCLTVAQILKFAPEFLATRGGLYLSGLVAGLATGLASVGGMVIALYILASGSEPKQMRASLVMYLAIGMFTSLFYLFAYGMLTREAIWRGALMSPLVLLGVGLGSLLFRPAHERFYKKACLLLLMLLAATGLTLQLF
ncbi:sulfite exporter TauE/SafE family protein [Hoeflea sp. AS60]|uniref:sulfite exporter TauE/SafE family protein n=1 Tax=Hoeflea sp. AS60 TaxID=3135780 RepID=UPI003177D612